MKVVLRICGQVNLNRDIAETLLRLRLRKKLHCVFIDGSDKIKMGMLKKVESYVAYGDVSDELMKKIIDKRGQKDVYKKFRGFCRLHPPIGGFKTGTKLHYPKGVLGNNKEIEKLLGRML